MFDAKHLSRFIESSSYSAKGMNRSIADAKRETTNTQFSMSKDLSLAFRFLPRDHPSHLKKIPVKQRYQEELVHPLIPEDTKYFNRPATMLETPKQKSTER